MFKETSFLPLYLMNYLNFRELKIQFLLIASIVYKNYIVHSVGYFRVVFVV